jgi:hypothetical protein
LPSTTQVLTPHREGTRPLKSASWVSLVQATR